MSGEREKSGVRPWTFLDSEEIQCRPVFALKNERFRSPRTGREHEFCIVDCPNWVNVIPLTPEGNVILVNQYRFGTREFSLEIPGGMLDEGDTPALAARRELLEETGYAGEEPVLLGVVHPNPAFQTNRCYTYLIRNVTLKQQPRQDSTEDIEVRSVPLLEIPGLIQEGRITHSLVIAAFYWYFMNKAGTHAKAQRA